MVDPTQTPPPPGGRGGGGGSGTNVNSGGSNNNSGRGSGFIMPEMPSFMTNNNFNGGIGYGRGDPNNNLYGFGY
ncbi:hypothetical protein L195_g029472, partial [Trifolium pratense]